MSIRKPSIVFAALVAALGLPAAFAHHGWTEYNDKEVLNLTGTVIESKYENPHATIKVKTADKTWFAWLAPITRMESRGLNSEMVKVGATVTVVGYPSTAKPGEMRVERIIVGGKSTELR